jgi:tetratricopeptide (TPR) repeat protein
MSDMILGRLRAAWERDPGSLAFVPYGEALRRSGDLDEAIRVCRAGLDNRPNHSSGHLVLGRCFFDKGEISEAIREFEEVVSLDSRNALALRLLGLALKAKGWAGPAGPGAAIRPERRTDAERRAAAEELVEIEFFTETMAGIFERQGFLRKALEVYQRLASAHPERPNLRERIASLESALQTAESAGGGRA